MTKFSYNGKIIIVTLFLLCSVLYYVVVTLPTNRQFVKDVRHLADERFITDYSLPTDKDYSLPTDKDYSLPTGTDYSLSTDKDYILPDTNYISPTYEDEDNDYQKNSPLINDYGHEDIKQIQDQYNAILDALYTYYSEYPEINDVLITLNNFNEDINKISNPLSGIIKNWEAVIDSLVYLRNQLCNKLIRIGKSC